MIRELRQRHRVMIFTLSVIVPGALAVGIATRKPVLSLSETVPGFSAEVASHQELWSRDDLWEKTAIHTRLLSENASVGQLAIELTSNELIVRPDVLVYWVPGERSFKDAPPDQAILLGSFDSSDPTRLTLPKQAASSPGTLLLYSLADHELVAVSKPFTAK
jgi:hypothetical protein